MIPSGQSQATAPPVSRLSSFFRDADTGFGVFDPRHYLPALFPNLTYADSARRELKRAGRVEEDVISASGEEVVQFAEEHFVKDGLWGMLMTEYTRTRTWRRQGRAPRSRSAPW